MSINWKGLKFERIRWIEVREWFFVSRQFFREDIVLAKAKLNKARLNSIASILNLKRFYFRQLISHSL